MDKQTQQRAPTTAMSKHGINDVIDGIECDLSLENDAAPQGVSIKNCCKKRKKDKKLFKLSAMDNE